MLVVFPMCWGCAQSSDSTTARKNIPRRARESELTQYVPGAPAANAAPDLAPGILPSPELDLLLNPSSQPSGDNQALPASANPVPVAAESPLEAARRLLRSRDYQSAVLAYRRALDTSPQTARVHFELALALTAAGEPSRALPYLDRALELDPDLLEARLERGNNRLARREPAAALEDFETALSQAGEQPVILCALGNASIHLSAYDDALRWLNRSIEIDPDFATAYVIRGLCHLALRDPSTATADLNEAIRCGARAADLQVLQQQIELFRQRTGTKSP